MEVTDYLDGQLAVDRLSDAGFPVEGVKIVGHDMKSVEVVTGRMTIGKAAGLGALSGLWFGLFVGVLFGIFAIGGWLTIVITALILGALFGAIAGDAGHAMPHSERELPAAPCLIASRNAARVLDHRVTDQHSILGLHAPEQ